MSKYDDILHLPRPVSKRRAGMSMTDRAAQFSPFAALTGFDEAIRETGRLTDSRQEPGEERKWELDRAFRLLLERLDREPEVRLTWFREDPAKDGGAYLTRVFRIRKLDLHRRVLTAEDGTLISMDDIWEMVIL